MTLGVGLEQELGDEFGGVFDDFDEFGGAFVVFLLRLEMRLLLPPIFFHLFCLPPSFPSFRPSLPSLRPSLPPSLPPSVLPSIPPPFPLCSCDLVFVFVMSVLAKICGETRSSRGAVM